MIITVSADWANKVISTAKQYPMRALASEAVVPFTDRTAYVIAEYGGHCRIRTCDFHRVKVALYR